VGWGLGGGWALVCGSGAMLAGGGGGGRRTSSVPSCGGNLLSLNFTPPNSHHQIHTTNFTRAHQDYFIDLTNPQKSILQRIGDMVSGK